MVTYQTLSKRGHPSKY